jgi:hypothetical protein
MEGRSANPTHPEPVALDAPQRAALVVFAGCYMDGMAIGWHARGLADKDREGR